MKKSTNTNTDLNKKIELIEKEYQPALYEQSLDRASIYDEAEKVWNSKILTLTMKIKNGYPELSKYIEEMPITIPDEKKPEISLNNLKGYFESLQSTLDKYILELKIKKTNSSFKNKNDVNV